MSLALVAIGDSSVAVASDAGITRYRDDGSLAAVAANYKKFREVVPGVVIVPMGTTWLAEKAYAAVEGFANEHRDSCTFQILVDFLATSLPIWHKEHEQLAPTLPDGASRGQVALAGLDHETGRGRLVLFNRHTGYAPDESYGCLVLGWWSPDDNSRLAQAYERGTDGHAWSDVMAQIIGEASKECEFVSGHAYATTIEWESKPLPDGRKSIALDTRHAEYTTAAVQ